MNVRQLYSQCAKLIGDSFPEGMRGIDPPAPIKGLGFFPVTSGSFHSSDLDAQLKRGVMFVGQDFGCEAYVIRCRKKPSVDIQSGTGLVLHQLIQKSEIPIFDECQPWIGKTFKEIDESGHQLITLARRVGNVSTLAILVHPSFSRLNVQSRRFRNAEGTDAEVELLAATWAAVNHSVL